MRVLVREECKVCGGKGYIESPHCGACLDPVDFDWIDRALATMRETSTKPKLPCGHPMSELVDEMGCGECEGEGVIDRWVSLSELWHLLLESKDEEETNAH